MNAFPQLPSKLLLFGEYSIFAGSAAITLPLWNYHAQLRIPEYGLTPDALSSHTNLKNFYNYLIDNKKQFENYIDLKSFSNALDKGLFLKSNIPEGYGLGSSGNVCVSIFKAFQSGNPGNLPALKSLFSAMESFFHGKSSGMDPLSIYAEKPLLIQGDQIEIIESSKTAFQENIYLLDSGISRISGSFIQSFISRIQEPAFLHDFISRYLPVLDQIIQSITHDPPLQWEALKSLSSLQLKFFEAMIPPAVQKAWESTISDKDTCIKLLGAGGGGFFLVFSKKEMELLQTFPLIKIQTS